MMKMNCEVWRFEKNRTMLYSVILNSSIDFGLFLVWQDTVTDPWFPGRGVGVGEGGYEPQRKGPLIYNLENICRKHPVFHFHAVFGKNLAKY